MFQTIPTPTLVNIQFIQYEVLNNITIIEFFT